MNKVWLWYKNYSHSWLDFIWTAAVIVVCFTVLDRYWPVEIASQDRTVYASIATIAGTLLGFAITAISVLIAFWGGEDFEWLRKHPDYARLFGDFKRAVLLFGSTTMLSVVALLISETNEEVRGQVLLGLVLWLSLLSGVTLLHAVRILWLAIRVHSMASRDL